MKAGLKIQQKGLLLVLVPLIFELAFVATLVFVQRQAEQAVAQEDHSRAIVVDVQHMIITVFNASEAFVKYTIYSDPKYAGEYEGFISQVPAGVD
ncbi:MAG: hypothetical protein ACRD3W_08090, partial [Terriglobales bacterium]